MKNKEPKSITELQEHGKEAVEKVQEYIDSLVTSGETKKQGKADKLCYWLKDWMTFLEFEEKFDPKRMRRYKRGEIIKVHLGFNVGSEEGGLHYAVVLDKNNAKSSPVVTVIPLTSVKPHTDVTKLHAGSIFLGNDLYISLNAKIKACRQHLVDELDSLKKIIYGKDVSAEVASENLERIEALQKEVELYGRMQAEIQRMKRGSIALVSQITTISKIRIYDPKTDHDILSGIKLSNEKLNMIDAEIIKNFTL